MDNIQNSLKNVNALILNAQNDRLRLKSIFEDVLPYNKLHINLLLDAYDSGIINTLKNGSVVADKSLFINRIMQCLAGDYGITEQAALWAIDSWCIILGITPFSLRKNNMLIRDYIVCYIDLMAQREGLLKKVRETNDLTSVQDRVNQTSWAIKNFNELLKGAMSTIITCPVQLLKMNGSSQDEIDNTLSELKDLSWGLQQFSDTTMFYVNADNNTGIGIFISFCLAFSIYYLELISKGILIRGGITIGRGWEIYHNCLYGPVIEDVHYLEEKIADYPRIVTTSYVYQKLKEIDYFDEQARCHSNIPPTKLTCAELFCEDLDGAYVLDYLSQSALKGYGLLFLPEVQVYQIMKEGFRFICEEYKAKQEEA